MITTIVKKSLIGGDQVSHEKVIHIGWWSLVVKKLNIWIGDHKNHEKVTYIDGDHKSHEKVTHSSICW